MTERISEHEQAELHCPACGERLHALSPEGLAQCPKCGEQVLAIPPEDEPSLDPSLSTGAQAADDSELSELRIRNISNLRRGAYRSRSYLIIAAGVCIVAAAKLIQIAIVAWHGQLHLAAIGDVLCALAAIMIFASIARKIAALTREIRQSRLQDPVSPPDLSLLGDGTHRYKVLEAMAARNDLSNPPPKDAERERSPDAPS